DEVQALERELVSIVADLLERPNPALRDYPMLRKPYAMFFYGLIYWTYIWYDPEGPVEPDQLTDMAADLFLDGFLAQLRTPATEARAALLSPFASFRRRSV